MLPINDMNKIKWACRRGMLELDVLLSRFLEEHYLSLSSDNKRLFIYLLEQPDPLLLAWCLNQEPISDPNVAELIKLIRHVAL